MNMTVDELVSALREMDAEDEVCLTDGWGEDYFPVKAITVAVDDDRIRRVVLND